MNLVTLTLFLERKKTYLKLPLNVCVESPIWSLTFTLLLKVLVNISFRPRSLHISLPQKIRVNLNNKELVIVIWMTIFINFFTNCLRIYATSNGKVLMLLRGNYKCEVVTRQAWCEQLRRRRAPCVALQCVCLRCTGRCDFAIVYSTDVTKYM